MKTKPSKQPENSRGVPAAADMPVLSLVTFILDWPKAQGTSKILDDSHVRFHFICKGRGTASSEVLNLWDWVPAKKRLFFAWNRIF